MHRRARIGLRCSAAALAGTLACLALFPGSAAAKVAAAQFAQARASAGDTVEVTAQPDPPAPGRQLRYFLIHADDVPAIFPKRSPVLFGRKARAASRDERLVPLELVANEAADDADPFRGSFVVPDGLKPGRHTTAALVCDRGCFLAPALIPPALTRASLRPALRRYVLEITEPVRG